MLGEGLMVAKNETKHLKKIFFSMIEMKTYSLSIGVSDGQRISSFVCIS